MKFLIIHNRYRTRGGEESVVDAQISILRGAGHDVRLYIRDYSEISGFWGRVGSFFTALSSSRAKRDIAQIVQSEKPDIALVHNLFPLISGAVLPILKSSGVKVAYFAHNFRLVCPTGLFFRNGSVCERCGVSSLGEWQCVRGRCEGSALGSVAFAARGAWSRMRGYFSAVDVICTLSDFQSALLAKYGVDGAKMRVVANPLVDMAASDAQRADFVGIVGRFSIEKGATIFLEAARRMPSVEFRVAGSVGVDINDAPSNVKFVGSLNSHQLANFYSSAKVVVSCSMWHETFGLTIVEAMYYGAVAIVPNWAAMPSLVDAPNSGLTYVVGDALDLASKIELVLSDNALWQSLSQNGKQRSAQLCSPTTYLKKLEDL